MCGISGRLNLDGRPVSAAEMVAMRDAMIHRGPDDQGLFVEGAIGLAHRRLSIIDLAGGHQPIANEDGTVRVVFNGEIYNYAEIRQGLMARGHSFATRSDTEVIVHLYEEMGADCVQRFRGMFAFALWDARERRLLLARDRLGIKPLYYARIGQSLIFASEIKSLLRAEGARAEVDPRGLGRYLSYRHSYGSGTLFKGISQLPPGHCLTVEAGQVRTQRYWDVPERAPGRPSPGRDDFVATLDEAVRLRMISDVPLGSFLSGGIDSSVITALMARRAPEVRTFSIGFVPGEENELGWARLVADHCGARHEELILGSEDFFSLLGRLVWHHDEPLTFPASIPLYLLSRASKSAATVMLAGEGADEILAGYSNNIGTYWLRRLSSLMPVPMLKLLARGPFPVSLRARAERASLDPPQLIARAFQLSGHQDIARACRVALPARDEDDGELLDEIGFPARQGTFLDRLLYFQLKTYLVALLMKQDKMSMAASIETRVPFLDHHLVELAFSLPDRSKIRGRQGKSLLRLASRGLIPDAVIDRRKQGFPVPIAQWLRTAKSPFIELLLDPETLRDGLVEADFVRHRVNRFLAGEEGVMGLWALLNLELWRRAFLAPAAEGRWAASG